MTGKTRNWSDEENARFRRMWLAGDTLAVMATEFDVALSSIVRHHKKLGLPDRPSPIHNPKPVKTPPKARPLRRGEPSLPPLKSLR